MVFNNSLLFILLLCRTLVHQRGYVMMKKRMKKSQIEGRSEERERAATKKETNDPKREAIK